MLLAGNLIIHPGEGLVRLHWLDITFVDEDLTEQEAIDQEPSKMETIGYLLADTETKTIVASTKIEDGYRCVISVPKGVVIKIEEL